MSRLQLVELHPEWIEEEFSAIEPLERTILITQNFASLPRIENPSQLEKLFSRCIAGEEEAKEALLHYSDDGETLYRIETLEFLEGEHIITFTEAKRLQLLSSLVDRFLQAEYLKVRAQYPEQYQSKEGAWRSFSEIKRDLAKQVFVSVFKAIERLEIKDWAEDLYASYRMLPMVQRALEELKENPEEERWVQREGDVSLAEQFKLERHEQPIQRINQEKWMKDKAFQMLPNEWSPIHVPPTGDIAFFYLMEKQSNDTPILDQIAFSKELIAADAQRYLAEKLLKEIAQKQSIIIPIQREP